MLTFLPGFCFGSGSTVSLASTGSSSGAAAVAEPGGQEAMVQRLAEKYVSELAEMAKHSNVMIVPDRPNDLSAVVGTAMGLHGELTAKARATKSVSDFDVPASKPSTPTSGDWVTR